MQGRANLGETKLRGKRGKECESKPSLIISANNGSMNEIRLDKVLNVWGLGEEQID